MSSDNRINFSGVYPHLAVFNQGGGECGIGALVPWAKRLWYLTYCPHSPWGSPDKLYALDAARETVIRPESVGGTPACRMIHRESNQLLIGPYVISAEGDVRVIPPHTMPGRLSGVCRHLTDPENKVYYLDMEGTLFECNIHTLEVKTLFVKPVPGWHGKGLYQGQGRIVISNNGEWHVASTSTTHFQVEDLPESPDRLGCLAEWEGHEWRIIERKQHTEVAGPGGLYGNDSDADPIWTMGWDKRSCLLKVLDNGTWHAFRMPKANYTYDGDHGWHTEWPRIRQVADGFLMMDLHGMFYELPATFSAAATGGIRPLSSHHQMVVDYCEWQGQTAVACNHASRFDNPLLGTSQSNLWFVDKAAFVGFGPRTAWGGPWIDDDVTANQNSVPYFFAGFDRRVLHLTHKSPESISFALELDAVGNDNWQHYQTLTVATGDSVCHHFANDVQAEWIRIRPLTDASAVTAYFHYNEDPAKRLSLTPGQSDAFKPIPPATDSHPMSGGIVRPMGNANAMDETRLQFIAKREGPDGRIVEQQYIVDQDMVIRQDDDPAAYEQFTVELAGEVSGPDFGMDQASVWIEEQGQRFRLPKGNAAFDQAFSAGWPRGHREIITERSVWNAHGSFYEIPRESSHGLRHMRPICTHNRKIMDFCTWRGLLTISGIAADAASDAHCVRSEDGHVALWFGAVDDLWKLGKPVGVGGPLMDSPVKAGEASDPYLMTQYDEKHMTLSHDADTAVRFTVEHDPTGHDNWLVYDHFDVAPGASLVHDFDVGFSTHWVRVRTDQNCQASAQFEYR